MLGVRAGGHKDHRQDPTGCCQPGEDLQGSSDHEDARPPTHHQTLPGELDFCICWNSNGNSCTL